MAMLADVQSKIEKKRQQALQGGGPKRIEAQHKRVGSAPTSTRPPALHRLAGPIPIRLVCFSIVDRRGRMEPESNLLNLSYANLLHSMLSHFPFEYSKLEYKIFARKIVPN